MTAAARLTASCIAIALLAASAGAWAEAWAQRSRPAEAPYPAVAVTLPTAFGEPEFAAFRQELAAVAKARIYAELQRLVLPIGFFWDRDFNQRFDAGKPAVDNLAVALRLEHRGGAGWSALADFAAEPSASPAPARPGVICTPGQPDFDGVAFDRLLDDTHTVAAEWVHPRAEGVAVRAAAHTGAPVIETLGLSFVRLLDPAAKDEDSAARTAWVRLATPTGKTGFAPPGALVALQAERLCYGKDSLGRWRIAGFVSKVE